MMPTDRSALIDDELIMIRHSGEIPEIALHNAYYFLSQDLQGPHLELSPTEIRRLQQAVVERYRRIIRRDLDPRLRDKSVYRGIERCIANWERLGRFAAREQFAMQAINAEVADALDAFLQQEIDDVLNGRRATSINCGWERLQAFCAAVGFNLAGLPPEWKRLHQVLGR